LPHAAGSTRARSSCRAPPTTHPWHAGGSQSLGSTAGSALCSAGRRSSTAGNFGRWGGVLNACPPFRGQRICVCWQYLTSLEIT
jgi:hypothetical protein